LGENCRKTVKNNVVYAWDELGILAFQSKEDPDMIDGLNLFVLPVPFSHCPKKPFIGTIYVGSNQIPDCSKLADFTKVGFVDPPKPNGWHYLIMNGYSAAVGDYNGRVDTIDIGEIKNQ
jgi:hypothetical protein